MGMFVNSNTVTVVRGGKTLKVKPDGQPFDFTADEVAVARKAGIQMQMHRPAAPKAVVETAPTPKSEKPATEAKGKKRAAAAAAPSDDDEGI